MASDDIRVLVLANCIHHSLAQALRASEVFAEVQSAELYSMSDEARAALADGIDRYRFVLSLEHGEGFGGLATSALRDLLGERLVSLPTPFFSGLMPDMAYLRYGGEIARTSAVLGDYHSALILEEVRAGLSSDDIVRRYVSGEAFDRLDVQAVWNENFAELRAREAQTDLAISPYLEHAADEGRLAGQFLSFNHPTEGVINHIAQSFIQHTTGQDGAGAVVTPEDHNLYADAYWPLHPAVAERLGLSAPTQTLFKQPNRLGGAHLEMDDFVRRSVAFFSSKHDPENFVIATPHYLARHIKPATAAAASASAPGTAPAEAPARAPAAAAGDTPRKVIMTHFGRSGSTVLAELLKQHSKIAWIDEFFSLKWIHERETYDFSLQQMIDMVDAEVARVHETAPDAMVGHEIKLMNFMQNPGCNMIDYARATASPEEYVHIVLRRRNVLKRVCSIHKAAQTKVYHVKGESSDYKAKTFRLDFDNLVDYDTGQRAPTFPELIDKVLEREEQVLTNYRAVGIRYLELSYEDDIESDPLVAYSKAIEFLGLPAEPARVSLDKTSAGLRNELENYDELEAQMQGSEHAWMLQ